MVRGEVVDQPRQARRSATRSRCTGGSQRYHVCAEYRLSVALYPSGPSAKEYGVWLSATLGLRRNIGKNPLCALPKMPRTSGPKGQSHGLCHREPERGERGKRG